MSRGDIVDVIKSEFRNLRDNNTEIIYTPGRGELNNRGSLPSYLFDFNASFIFSLYLFL